MQTPKIDGRTRQAKAVKEIKDGLTQSPNSTGKALLKTLVAQNMTIAQEVFNAAMTAGDLIDEKGKLTPAIERTYMRFQSAAKQALTELLKLESNAKPDGEPEDAFEELFDE